MRRRKKRRILPFAALLIISAIVIALFVYMKIYTETFEQPDPVQNGPVNAQISPGNIHEIESRLPSLVDAYREDRRNVILPGHLSIPVIDEDINGNGYMETIAVEFFSSGPVHNELRAEGFQGPVRHLKVITLINSQTRTLLNISPESIEGTRGNRLIEQVAATHGYAFRLSKYDGEPYNQSVRLIELIILDASGNAMSDDLTIYWMPSTEEYAATNTFGAPDTF